MWLNPHFPGPILHVCELKKAQNLGSYPTVETMTEQGVLELHANATFEMSAKNTETGGTDLTLFRLVHDHRGPGMHWVGELAAGCWHSPPSQRLPTALSMSLFRRH